MKKAATLFILVFLFCLPLFASVTESFTTVSSAEEKEVM